MPQFGKDHHNFKHGLAGTRVFESWKFMMRRCYQKENHGFHLYGGRGIKVCKRWHDVKLFYKDMGNPKPGFTLDRINNSKNYSKKNCRWANAKTQARNRRSNVLITYRGETNCALYFAEKYEIPKYTFWRRIKLGYTGDKLFYKGHLFRDGLAINKRVY